MKFHLNMFGSHISRRGKKIFNDINDIPMYLFDVINESLHELKGVKDPKQKIINSYHISPFNEEISRAFKEKNVRKAKIQLEDSMCDEK